MWSFQSKYRFSVVIFFYQNDEFVVFFFFYQKMDFLSFQSTYRFPIFFSIWISTSLCFLYENIDFLSVKTSIFLCLFYQNIEFIVIFLSKYLLSAFFSIKLRISIIFSIIIYRISFMFFLWILTSKNWNDDCWQKFNFCLLQSQFLFIDLTIILHTAKVYFLLY